MAGRIPFTYGNFYDVPRQLEFQFQEEWYFLRSYFDEEKDDYASFYEVYLLPFRSEAEIKANPDYWLDLSNTVHLGQIPINEIGLDETRRSSIDASAFSKWLLAHRKAVDPK